LDIELVTLEEVEPGEATELPEDWAGAGKPIEEVVRPGTEPAGMVVGAAGDGVTPGVAARRPDSVAWIWLGVATTGMSPRASADMMTLPSGTAAGASALGWLTTV
jgi:hypothetical protein